MKYEDPQVSPSSTAKLFHVQALRGIAALLVMMAHIYDSEVKYSADQLFGTWTLYGNIGVDIFFLISGFIMVYVTWGGARGLKAAAEFLFSRVCRIYPLYWAVSLAVLCVYLIRPELVFSSREVEPSLIKSFLLLPDVVPPLLLVGWTLIFEMYFYIIFTGIMLLKRQFFLPLMALWALIILAGRALGWHEFSPTTELIFNPLTFEFLTGALIAYLFQTQRNLLDKYLSPKAINYFGLIVLAVLFVFFGSLNQFPQTDAMRFILFVIPIALIIVYAVIRDHFELKVWRPTVVLGDWSYALYLTHILSIAIIGRLWQSHTSSGLFDNAAAIIAMLILSIIVSGIAYKLIEQPALKLTRHIRRKLFHIRPH